MLEHAIANLRTIVAALKDPTAFPDGSTVIIMDVYDPTDGEGGAAMCTGNRIIPGLAAAFDVWRGRYTEFAMSHDVAMLDILCRFRGTHGTTTTRRTHTTGQPTRRSGSATAGTRMIEGSTRYAAFSSRQWIRRT